MPVQLTDPAQLNELLGIPFTPEQLACITAPPAPQVIVAGAGSGKTTVMAARVVWLVGTGQVAPEQVLGLTFTNKAAGELTERVRKALVRAGVTDPDPVGPDEAAGEPQISTYHAFAGRLLAEHGLRLGIEPGARLLADATRFQLAARVLRSAPGPFDALDKSVAALVEDLLALDAELSEHLVPPGALRAHDTALLASLEDVRLGNAALRKVPRAALGRGELLGLVEQYRSAKRARDLLDFGDQIALAATLARDVPQVGRIMRAQFSVVLLDEYQDTSVAQRVLLSGLFGAGGGGDRGGDRGGADRAGGDGDGGDRAGDGGRDGGGAPAEGAGHAVTAVGDPCQAIYGWRGASVANLDDFPRHFPHADGTPARRFALGENRRSGGRLLRLANSLAAPLRERHQGVEALRPAPGAELAGLVRCALLPTHEEEIEWLADALAHLVRTGTPPAEIAVLCRGAGDFAEIQGALVARDVPVEVVGLSGLLHLPEVADLVAMCEVLQDPTANASLVRLLTGPRWRIGPRDLALLGRRARLLVQHDRDGGDGEQRLAAAVEGVDPAEVISLADALDTFLGASGREDDLPFSAAARVRFARLAREIRELRRSLADPLMDVLHRVLTVTGLEVELSASPHAVAARRRETLDNFLDVAARFAALDGEATLLAFLGFLGTAARYEKGLDSSLPGGENTVKVLTAHKSKGLEWDVVAVPGLVARQFPSEQPRESWLTQPRVLPPVLRGDAATLPEVEEWSAKGLKDYDAGTREHQATEELRLGYVTFTRPRSLLLGSGHWWGPSQKRRRGPSSFLDALREHCEADPAHGEVEAWADEPEKDAENPSLASAAEERAWPLPLDPEALVRRRTAAEAVLGHLARHREDGEREDGEREDRDPGAGGGAGAGRGVGGGAGGGRTGLRTGGRGEPEERVPGVPAQTGASRPAAEPGGDDGDSDDDGGSDDVMGSDARICDDSHDDAGSDPGAGSASASASASASDSASGPGAGTGLAPDTDTGTDSGTGTGSGSDTGTATDHAHESAGGDAAASLAPEESRLAASWDRDLEALAGELRRSRAPVREVPLPSSLSASQLLRLAADPEAFARQLARPMPQPPQPAAARRGTRFHAWVASRFEELTLPMLGPEELPGYGGEADGGGSTQPPEIADERELAALKEAFARTPFAHRTPFRVEEPFQLTLAGRVIRGRIDAVYRDTAPDGTVTYEIVDWKTSRRRSADPLQLAIYRLAWAERRGVALEAVSAAFLYVRGGEVVRPDGLPGRAALERLLIGGDADEAAGALPFPDAVSGVPPEPSPDASPGLFPGPDPGPP